MRPFSRGPLLPIARGLHRARLRVRGLRAGQQVSDEGCPKSDPDCLSNADECHDACEAPGPKPTYEPGIITSQRIHSPYWGGADWTDIEPERPYLGHPTPTRAFAEIEGYYRHKCGLVKVHGTCRYKSGGTGWIPDEGHVSYSTMHDGREHWRFDKFTNWRPSQRKIVHQARKFLLDVVKECE